MDGFRISTTNPPEQITGGYPHCYLAEENGLYKWQESMNAGEGKEVKKHVSVEFKSFKVV